MKAFWKKTLERIASIDLYEAFRRLVAGKELEFQEARWDVNVVKSLVESGKHLRALRVLRQAKPLFEAKGMEAEVATCLFYEGVICSMQDDHRSAVSYYESAKAIFEKLGMDGNHLQLKFYLDASVMMLEQGEYDSFGAWAPRVETATAPDPISRWRISNKLSVARGARKVGVDPKTFERWERGDVPPSEKNAQRLRFLLEGGSRWNAATETAEFMGRVDRQLRRHIDEVIDQRGRHFLDGGYRDNAEAMEYLKNLLGDMFPSSSEAELKGEVKDLIEETITLSTFAGFCVAMLKYAESNEELDKWTEGGRSAFYDLAGIKTLVVQKGRRGIDESFWGQVFSEFFSHGYATALESRFVSLLEEMAAIKDSLSSLKDE